MEEQSKPLNRKRDISSEWFRALVESALDGVVTMDDKGRIIALNPAAERIFGFRSDQVAGHPVSETQILRGVACAILAKVSRGKL